MHGISDDLEPMKTSSRPSESQQPPVVKPNNELHVNEAPTEPDGMREEEEKEEMGTGFQRRNAKRGMSFKPRVDSVPISNPAKGNDYSFI